MEMLNDSFSMQPNGTNDTGDMPANHYSNEFIMIDKDEISPHMRANVNDPKEPKDGGDEGGDQFNQSFGPENSYQQE